ncbi:uncharacterized protein LOC123321937 [Coccinella septempunctata]|uniref:uncharacterized protein LOC123321937 n=1 Tax=Coccinella septempunctata TaxID=41139 RepID=UPI001D08DDE3|nr:uncharacterized protein LOC123321937 [Coccinella septempunctata]
MLIFQSPFMLGILGYIYVAFRGGVYDSIIYATYAFNFVATVQACIIFFLIRGKNTLQFLANLGSAKYGKPKNFDYYIALTEQATAWLHNTIIVEEILIAITTNLKSAFCDEKAILNDERIVCGLIVPLWFPFKIPYAKLILSIYLAFFLPYLAAQTCGNIMYIGSIIPTLQKINQLKDFLRNIKFEDENSSHQSLKFCAKYYAEINELVDQMNHTVGFIMSPAQNVLVIVMVGILEYQAVNEKNILAALQLVIWLMIQFLSCFAGQLLENASASITQTVYDIEWYEMHPSLRNTYKIFHAQCQGIMHCKIQPLITMNMEYFYKVMQSSYSFLMFLSNF